MADEQKATVEIEETVDETVEEQPVSIEDAETVGLSKEEIEMGKTHGEIVDDDPEDKGEDEKKEDKPEKKEAKADDQKEDAEDIIDDPEKELETVKDYTPNEKAQYFQRKKERSKRQKAERKAELLEIKLKAEQEKSALLEKGKTKKDDFEDLDAELDADLNGNDDDDDDSVVTKGDLKKREEEKEKKEKAKREEAETVRESLAERQKTAREEDANFDEYCTLANEVILKDKEDGGVYSMKLLHLAGDPEGDIASYIKKLAKLHDDFGKVGTKKDSSEKVKDSGADKIIKNASKRTTSASVGGGSGRRVVSEDDLTLQDASNLSDEQYAKLKPETRERLLKL